ncbi:hypothetical protein, partial [Acinetobacter baumannii]|uniref:hypothetical protein n=1 Tax=Acinetobacter baumannii TaxID=470 RepID=UPI00241F567C
IICPQINNTDLPVPGLFVARQVGGPFVEPALWGALIPRPSVSIVGRVPIDGSRKFLRDSGLPTSSKELVIAVLEGFGPSGAHAEHSLRQFLV